MIEFIEEKNLNNKLSRSGYLSRGMNDEKARIKTSALGTPGIVSAIALGTPGIVSAIASHIDVRDQGLKGLFLLVNDERYRHELEPFVRLRAQIDLQEKRYELIRAFHVRVFSSLEKIPLIVSKRKRCQQIIRMYEYICSQEETMKLYPMQLIDVIYDKLDDLEEEVRELDNLKDSYKEYVCNRFAEFRTGLQKHI